MRFSPLIPILLLAACGSDLEAVADNQAAGGTVDAAPASDAGINIAGNGNMAAPGSQAEFPPLDPPQPGEPGGLPDDRTPISEAPFTETSAQGAANVVQSYYALLGQNRYAEAWRLWSDGGRSSGMSAEAFAASFNRYREYHAQIGAPGQIEGAAGSLYVEVPVQVYGRLQNGQPFNMLGPVRLRRCNDVPGCTEEQKKWRIAESGIRPRPAN